MMIDTLRGKMTIGFVCLLGLLTGQIVQSQLGLAEAAASVEVLSKQDLEVSVAAGKLASDLNEVRAALLTLMAVEGADRERARGKIKALTEEIDGLFGSIDRSDADRAQLIQKAEEQWRAFRETRDGQLLPAVEAGHLDEARALAFGIQRERYQAFSGFLRDVIASEEVDAQTRVQQAQSRARTVELTGLAVGGLALLVAAALALTIKRATDRIRAITLASAQLSAGGAAARTLEGDEIAALVAAFTAMVESSAGAIDAGAKEVQRSLTELAAGYAQQSTGVSETVTTLDELRAAAVSGSDRAKEVLEQSRQVDVTARSGAGAVSDVIEAMGRIRAQVGLIATSVLDMSERAQRIGEIVESVSGIADHSKLLALNAAIEAAKAGEYGHGFAVVAEEVRALADRSQASTREIAGILREIQKATSGSVMATEDGSKAVDRGLQLVDTAKGTIHALGSTIESNSRNVEQIAHAVRQQSVGVTQISEAMNGIVAAVRQGTDESSRIKEAMGALVVRVEAMRDVLSRFRGVAA
jgi:methyl-accepting chemotaxis protein